MDTTENPISVQESPPVDGPVLQNEASSKALNEASKPKISWAKNAFLTICDWAFGKPRGNTEGLLNNYQTLRDSGVVGPPQQKYNNPGYQAPSSPKNIDSSKT